MAKRLTRRPRQVCPLGPAGVGCHSFGQESACRLCDMLDLDAPVSAVTLGNLDAPSTAGAAEQAFWDHLARRRDGGPSNPRELATWLARRREADARRMAREIYASHPDASDLPADAPF